MVLRLTLWSLNVLLIVFGILDFIPIQIPLLIGINLPFIPEVTSETHLLKTDNKMNN